MGEIVFPREEHTASSMLCNLENSLGEHPHSSCLNFSFHKVFGHEDTFTSRLLYKKDGRHACPRIFPFIFLLLSMRIACAGALSSNILIMMEAISPITMSTCEASFP